MKRLIEKQISHAGYLYNKVGLVNAVKLRFAEIFRFKTVRLHINDVPVLVRPRTTDMPVAATSLNGEFDHLAEELSLNFDGLIIDGGGYIGTAAIALSKLFPKALIATVEPSSRNYEILQRNICEYPNIRAFHAALAAQSGGSVELTDHGTGDWGLSVIKQWADHDQPETVEVIDTISIEAIQSFFPTLKIGLLKLDIEGAEKEIFENATTLLNEIPIIFVELHERFLPGCDAAFQSFSKKRKVKSFDGKEKMLSVLIL